MNIGIYIRVARHHQSQDGAIYSQESQNSALMNYIETKGVGELYRIYIDKGFSGLPPYTQRPELIRLIEDAKEGKIKTVVFHNISRLSRDVVEAYQLIELLKESGCRVVSVSEGYDSELAKNTSIARVPLYDPGIQPSQG